MIDQAFVQTEVWGDVRQTIRAVAARDATVLGKQFKRRSMIAGIYTLFGITALEILFKTVLSKEQVALMQAVELDVGKKLLLEYGWVAPNQTEITIADVVTVQLELVGKRWLIAGINPAPLNAPLTEPRAQLTLADIKMQAGELPSEGWILPYTFVAGALQLPLQTNAGNDPVEKALLAGLQQRTHGIFSLMMGRKLWLDFKKKRKPKLTDPTLYSAGIEYLLSELAGRQHSPATVAEFYGLSLVKILPIIQQLKSGLKIKENDSRYAPNAGIQIMVES